MLFVLDTIPSNAYQTLVIVCCITPSTEFPIHQRRPVAAVKSFRIAVAVVAEPMAVVAVVRTCLDFRGILRWVVPIGRPLVVGWVPSCQRNRCEPLELPQVVVPECGDR